MTLETDFIYATKYDFRNGDFLYMQKKANTSMTITAKIPLFV